jgi:hypothetical protein
MGVPAARGAVRRARTISIVQGGAKNQIRAGGARPNSGDSNSSGTIERAA